MVVLLIIGLIAAISIPVLRSTKSKGQQDFVDHLQDLVALGWRRALSDQKTCRVFFDIKKRTMRVEQESGLDGQGEPIFKQLEATYGTTAYSWPDTIEIKQFFIDGKEAGKAGRELITVFFYILPQGYSQAILINLVDKDKKINNAEKGKPFSIEINPFSVQLTRYETFQQP